MVRSDRANAKMVVRYTMGYVFEANRVRPTFGGPKVYRAMRITALVMLGVGAIFLAAGITWLLVDIGGPGWLGWIFIAFGAIIAFVGAVLFPTIGFRRASLLIPDQPPDLINRPT